MIIEANILFLADRINAVLLVELLDAMRIDPVEGS